MALQNALSIRLTPAQAAYLEHLVSTADAEAGRPTVSAALRAVLDDHLREQVRRGHAPAHVRSLWIAEADADDLDALADDPEFGNAS